jgi:hypothetical protein
MIWCWRGLSVEKSSSYTWMLVLFVLFSSPHRLRSSPSGCIVIALHLSTYLRLGTFPQIIACRIRQLCSLPGNWHSLTPIDRDSYLKDPLLRLLQAFPRWPCVPGVDTETCVLAWEYRHTILLLGESMHKQIWNASFIMEIGMSVLLRCKKEIIRARSEAVFGIGRHLVA